MSNGLFADSNRVAIRAILENAFGVAPTSGVSRNIRYTSSSLAVGKDTAVSDEIRADRMVDSVLEVSSTSGGDLNIEMSAGSHDDFLAAFVMGAWSQKASFDRFQGVTVSITGNNTVAIRGGDYTGYFSANQIIKTEGFANPANNAYLTVSSVAFANGVTTVTVGGTGLVTEAGTPRSIVMDANDAIVVNNTTIRSGTSGARTFDSNSNDAFASLIAAGKLVSGQKIFVEGLGFESGTFVFADAPASGETVTVNDGTDAVVFQYGGTIPAGAKDVGAAANAAAAADQLAAGIQAAYSEGRLNVKAVSDGTDTVTVTNLNSTGGALTDGGDAEITTTDFSGYVANVRGVFTIASVADDAITVVEPVGTEANAGGVKVTIKASMLRNPGDPDELTPQSFTIQEDFTDIGQVFTRNGMRVGGFSYDVSSNAIITGSLTFQGTSSARGTVATLKSAPYTALQAPATEVLSATTNVGEVKNDGVELATAIQAISFSGEANLRNQFAIGSKFPRGIGTGRFNLTGSMTAYFENGDLFDKFLDHATVSITTSFEDAHGNTYYWTIPAAHFTSDEPAPGGIDQDVLEELEFTAKRDPVTSCMLQIDRFSSVKAPTA